MKIHEILKEQFFRWDPDVACGQIEVTEDVHNLAREVANLHNRVNGQRARLSTLEEIQAGYATYWQRRAKAAETILKELGDRPVSERSKSLETVSAHYLRRYLEAVDTIKRMQERRGREHWGHNDL